MKKNFLFLAFVIGIYCNVYAQCDEIYNEYASYIEQHKYQDALKDFNTAQGWGCDWATAKVKADLERKIANAASKKSVFRTRLISVDSSLESLLELPLIKAGEWELVSVPEWLQVEENSSDVLRFRVTDNNSVYERKDDVVIRNTKEKNGQTYSCSVIQTAAETLLDVTKNIGFRPDGGTSMLFVETNDTSWIISSPTVSWISLERTSMGVWVKCLLNPKKQKRSTNLKITTANGLKSQLVSISQEIGRTTLNVANSGVKFSSWGGDTNIDVASNYDDWIAETAAGWIHVQKRANGIKITCDENYKAISRSGMVYVKSNDEENLVRVISIDQSAAAPYLTIQDKTVRNNGTQSAHVVRVKTNIPDWDVAVQGGESWCKVQKKSSSTMEVYTARNDWNYSRTAEVKCYGQGKSDVLSVYQPNRGYAGRYNDYFDANGGSWRVSWFGMEVGVLTSLGINVSTLDVRWKPVELSLVNFNMNYDFLYDSFGIGWEPIVRGFLPVSRDGRWAAFVGMGAHVDFIESSHFLIEFGMESQWNEKYSSRIFFKYNGGCVLGMSFDIGTWY